MAIERESGERERVEGLPFVMPTTKQWGKVEMGLGLGNFWEAFLECSNTIFE